MIQKIVQIKAMADEEVKNQFFTLEKESYIQIISPLLFEL